jgi:hypothetical protein
MAVNDELAVRGTPCDCRPETGLRLGPHFYNSDDELRYAVEQNRGDGRGDGRLELARSTVRIRIAMPAVRPAATSA